MIWKPFIAIGIVWASRFLPVSAREWVAPACLSVAAGVFWGVLLVALPLRKFFDVSEGYSMIAMLVFTLAFVLLYTPRLKTALDKRK